MNPFFLSLMVAFQAIDWKPESFLSLDEIYSKSVISAVTQGSRTLFLGVVSNGPQTVKTINIYDFIENRAWEIKDGRIGSGMKTVALAGETGFVLVDINKMTRILLDQNGNFLSSKNLRDFQGYDNDLTVSVATPFPPHRIVLTGLHLPNTQEIHMVVLDLLTEQFKTVFTNEIESHGAFWFPQKKGWCLVFPETGRLDLFNTQFQQLRTLIQPGVPHPVVTDPGVRKLLKQRGVSPNARLLTPPATWIGDTCYFRNKHYSDGVNYRYRVGALNLNRLIWFEEGDLPLGEYQGVRLIYNCNSGDFHRR